MPDLVGAWGLANLDLIVKFDPTQLRAPNGEWTADDSASTRTTVTDPHAGARQRAERAESARGDSARTAELRDQIKLPALDSRALKTAADKAVKDLGIPAGKDFSRLSDDRKKAARQMMSAARALVRLRAREARLNERLDKIKKELGARGSGPKTRAYLRRQLASTTTALNGVKDQTRTAEASLSAGRRAWGH